MGCTESSIIRPLATLDETMGLGTVGGSCFTFSPDGTRIVTGSSDTFIRAFSARTAALRTSHRGTDNGPVKLVAFSHDGRLLASAADAPGGVPGIQVMQLSECRSRKLVARSVHKLATKTPITDLVFSPDGRNLAAASSARVWLFEVASGKLRATIKRDVSAIQFSMDSEYLVCADLHEVVRFLSPRTGREHFHMSGHESAVLCLAIGPEGKTVASGSDDCTARLWNIAQRKEALVLQGHEASITCIHYLDAVTLLTASWDCSIRRWDLTNSHGACTAEYKAHKKPVLHLAISPDRRRFVSAGQGNTLRLWDPQQVKCLGLQKGAAASVRSMAFSPTDSTLLVTCDQGWSIRLWGIGEPPVKPTKVRPQLTSDSGTKAAASPGGASVGSSRSITSAAGFGGDPGTPGGASVGAGAGAGAGATVNGDAEALLEAVPPPVVAADASVDVAADAGEKEAAEPQQAEAETGASVTTEEVQADAGAGHDEARQAVPATEA